jgi:hypothetical protein
MKETNPLIISILNSKPSSLNDPNVRRRRLFVVNILEQRNAADSFAIGHKLPLVTEREVSCYWNMYKKGGHKAYDRCRHMMHLKDYKQRGWYDRIPTYFTRKEIKIRAVKHYQERNKEK